MKRKNKIISKSNQMKRKNKITPKSNQKSDFKSQVEVIPRSGGLMSKGWHKNDPGSFSKDTFAQEVYQEVLI